MKKSILALTFGVFLGTTVSFAQQKAKTKKTVVAPSLSVKPSNVFVSNPLQNEDHVPAHRSCASVPPPIEWENAFQQDIQEFLASPEASQRGATYRIPVIVHVIHNSTSGATTSYNPSATQINSQITALNKDFSATNTDVGNIPSTFASVASGDVSIEFCMATKDPSGNTLSEPGIERILYSTIGGVTWSSSGLAKTTIDGTIKPNTIWDVTKYFNIWLVPIENDILGYATFPIGSTLTGITGSGTTSTDGVVIWGKYFGTTGSVVSPFNKGRTATHEIGHWLGLRHIWGDNTCATDYCTDTPTQEQENYNCPTHPLNVGGCSGNTTGEMFMNYMDYVNDACMYMFTAGQKTRMQTCMTKGTYRKTLTASANTVCSTPAAAPVAAFIGTPTTIAPGGTVSFTDQSTNVPTTWTWSASPSAGVVFSSTSAQNPTATFATAGVYTITLTAANATGSDAETKTDYITVQAGTQNCDILDNIQAADTITYYGLNGQWGYWPGPNGYSMPAYAEKFANTAVGTVSNIYVTPLQVNQNSTSGVVTFKIYGVTNGKPGTVLTNGTKTVAYSALVAGDENTITFSPAVNVSGDFFVSCEFAYSSPQDTIVLGIAFDGSNASRVNTGYTKYQGAWYDNVSLWGTNSSHTIKAEVCPLAVAPTTDFSATPTTILTGGTVNFTDLSIGSPTTWTWSASPSTGVAFSSTSAQNPSATFANAGSYAITLTAANASGSDAETKTAYITVNAPAEVCDTILNVQETDTITYYGLNGQWGYWPGPNGYSIPAYAERFDNLNTGKIWKIFVMPLKVDAKSTSGVVTFKICNVTSGKPGSAMTNGTVTVPYTDLYEGEFNEISFANPVSVTGAFFVTCEFTYGTPQDTIVLGITFDGSNSSRVNTAFTKYSGTWYDNVTLWGTNSSHTIMAEVCPLSINAKVITLEHQVAIFPNPNKGKFVLATNFEKSTNIKVNVTDMVGRTVSTSDYSNITEKNIDVDLSAQPNGVYFVTISDGNSNITKKVSIVK